MSNLPYEPQRKRLNPIVLAVLRIFGHLLVRKGRAPTLVRVWTSRHLDDLQMISTVTIGILVILLALLVSICHLMPSADAHTETYAKWITSISAAAFAVLSWAYVVGSKRLGAVDLFASEISAICRVAFVSEFPKSSREQEVSFRRNRAPSGKVEFTIKEDYALVFKANLKETQPLAFETIKSITSFYTYRQTMLDLMRKIASLKDNLSRAKAAEKMIYAQYLMYESARYAVADLIEFSPERAESLINILCCEMYLYKPMVARFRTTIQVFGMRGNIADPRYQRLKLRRPEYDKWVRALEREIQNHHNEPECARAGATIYMATNLLNNLPYNIP